MSHYVVMVSEFEFEKLKRVQQELEAIAPEHGPEQAAYHDVWATCELCGEDCEYGVPVRLDQGESHTHGIAHPGCAEYS